MMGKVMMSGIVPPLVAPVTGIQLGDIAEGSIVKLNENGSPVEFYVAKHDYESSLNGSGRTLLVRKDCYGIYEWEPNAKNAYASSSIDTWLNATYKNFFDSFEQVEIGTTKFYYTIGNGNKTVSTLTRSIFILSLKELNKTATYANSEGSALPIATSLKSAYYNGSGVAQWTRTPCKDNTNCAYVLTSGGIADYYSCSFGTAYVRPCFTFPSSALFDEETMLFNGKIA